MNKALHFSFIPILLIAMEALNKNTGNILPTLVVITSLSVSSSKGINPGKSIKHQVVYIK